MTRGPERLSLVWDGVIKKLGRIFRGKHPAERVNKPHSFGWE
jgi:hypothetical protein